MSTTRVLLAGSNADERQWLAMVISSDSRMLLIGEAVGWQEVLDSVPALSPHIVLLDVDTLGNVPKDGFSQLAEEFSRTALVGLCQGEECRAEVLPHLDAVLTKDVPFNSLLGVVLEISKQVDSAGWGRRLTPPLDLAASEQDLPIAEEQPAESPGVTEGPQGIAPGGPDRWELRRGTLRLTVHPFRNFRSMLWFRGVLQQVDGVSNCKICLIRDGTLHLTVEYRGLIPIEERLEGLSQFEPAISETDSGCIDLRLGKAVSSRVTSLQESPTRGPMDYVLVS